MDRVAIVALAFGSRFGSPSATRPAPCCFQVAATGAVLGFGFALLAPSGGPG